MTDVEQSNLVSFLGTTRTLTLIWVLLGALVALLNLLSIVLSILTLHFPGGGLGGLAYAVIWVLIDLMILPRLGGWTEQVRTARYQSLKEPLLLWGVLGLLFGVVPGILLLLVYVRVLPWSDGRSTGPSADASGAGSTSAVPPPPPYGGAPSSSTLSSSSSSTGAQGGSQ